MTLDKPGRPAREQQRALRASRDRARGCAPALGSRARCASSRISLFGIALGFCSKCIFWRAACHASPLLRGIRHSGARTCYLPPILACLAFPKLSLGSRACCFQQGHFLPRCSGLLLEMQFSARGAQLEPHAESSTATARARVACRPIRVPTPSHCALSALARPVLPAGPARRDSGLLLESNLRPAVRSRLAYAIDDAGRGVGRPFESPPSPPAGTRLQRQRSSGSSGGRARRHDAHRIDGLVRRRDASLSPFPNRAVRVRPGCMHEVATERRPYRVCGCSAGLAVARRGHIKLYGLQRRLGGVCSALRERECSRATRPRGAERTESVHQSPHRH